MGGGQTIDAWHAARDRATDGGIDIETGCLMPVSAINDDSMSKTNEIDTVRPLGQSRPPFFTLRATYTKVVQPHPV